jgi:hypothetical protein
MNFPKAFVSLSSYRFGPVLIIMISIMRNLLETMPRVFTGGIIVWGPKLEVRLLNAAERP